MAAPKKYGNTSITPPRTTPRGGRTNTRPRRPIINEEERIPDKYEGDIVFNKTIYSKNSFESKVDIAFNELTTDTPPVNIEEFFNLYNEIFFDIPKVGENSHTTILETSRDYVTDYKNPLQDTVDSLTDQIETLSREKQVLQETLTQFETEEEQEEIAQATAEANYLAAFGGDLSNPKIKLSWLKINLDTGQFYSESRNSYKRNVKDDLNKAGAARGNVDRTASEWKADINNVGGSTSKKKGDLKSLVDTTVIRINQNKFENPGNAWKV